MDTFWTGRYSDNTTAMNFCAWMCVCLYVMYLYVQLLYQYCSDVISIAVF